VAPLLEAWHPSNSPLPIVPFFGTRKQVSTCFLSFGVWVLDLAPLSAHFVMPSVVSCIQRVLNNHTFGNLRPSVCPGESPWSLICQEQGSFRAGWASLSKQNLWLFSNSSVPLAPGDWLSADHWRHRCLSLRASCFSCS
jgi:hypothetical protein